MNGDTLLERARDEGGDGVVGRIGDAARRTLELRRPANRGEEDQTPCAGGATR